ncbi:MAG: arylsulfate sulfotransferase [Myxococcota bacterium]|jgi:arylsulfate sulfotransferase
MSARNRVPLDTLGAAHRGGYPSGTAQSSSEARVWWWLVACAGDPTGGGRSTATVADTAELGPGPVTTHPSAPLVASAAIAPTAVALAFTLTADADAPAQVTVHLDGPHGERTLAFPDLALTHDLPLVGLRAASEYRLTITLTASDGRSATSTLPLTTPPLPDGLPVLELRAASPDAEPGYTLFAPFRPEGGGWVVVVDDQGQPVWVSDVGRDWRAVSWAAAGGVQGLAGDALVEISWRGEERARFAADGDPAIEMPRLHHEAARLPDGGWYTLTNITRRIDGMPLDYERTTFGRAPIADPTVVRLAADGTTVASWSLAERLDPHRLGWNALDLDGGRLDWGHANAVVPVQGGFLVALRHQDAVVRVDEDSGEIRWILANPDGWPEALQPLLLRADGPLTWPAHAHAPELSADGRLLLFDNRNDGGSTPYSPDAGGPERSRIVEFAVDEAAGTVRQTWAWSATPAGELFSTALGDADRLPGGTVLASFAFLFVEDGIPNPERGRGNRSVRLFEVDPATDAVLWDLAVWDTAEHAPLGWQLDRAARIGALYPPEVVDSGWR